MSHYWWTRWGQGSFRISITKVHYDWVQFDSFRFTFPQTQMGQAVSRSNKDTDCIQNFTLKKKNDSLLLAWIPSAHHQNMSERKRLSTYSSIVTIHHKPLSSCQHISLTCRLTSWKMKWKPCEHCSCKILQAAVYEGNIHFSANGSKAFTVDACKIR